MARGLREQNQVPVRPLNWPAIWPIQCPVLRFRPLIRPLSRGANNTLVSLNFMHCESNPFAPRFSFHDVALASAADPHIPVAPCFCVTVSISLFFWNAHDVSQRLSVGSWRSRKAQSLSNAYQLQVYPLPIHGNHRTSCRKSLPDIVVIVLDVEHVYLDIGS